MCISWKNNIWLWVVSSRYTGQILAICVGTREWFYLTELWSKVPDAWKRRLVYTDGYGAYPDFFSVSQHRPCKKFDGGTCTAEGVNQSLRHRCGALVRRTSSRCRDKDLLLRRISYAVDAHNRAGWRRVNRRVRIAKNKRE
jgi:insertion element IS1 protein InsB